MTRRLTTVGVALGLTASTIGSGARAQTGQLPATERAIVRAADANNQAALDLLERLVNINSGSLNVAGVKQVGVALRSEFDALGFTTRWIDGASFGRGGHLVAEHPGSGPRLLLIGHLDTVFEPSSPFQRYQRLGDSARGPGVNDMKGGDVIIVAALKALKAAGALDRIHVTVIFTGDEESSGHPLEQSKAALVELARQADYAIGFEDGADDSATAVVSRRSAGGWTLRVTGTAAHSSQIFRADIGAGAIFETARILEAFRTRLQGQPYLTFNPGMALGGTEVHPDSGGASGSAAGKTNVVAARMEVRGDLRALSPEQLAAAQTTMREIVGKNLPGTTASIEFADGYPPLAPSEGNRRLLAVYDSASRALGFGPVTGVDPAKAGAADVSFTAPYVKGALDGIGLPGTGTHTETETADLRMLAPLTKRAALLLLWLSQSGAPRA